MGDKLPAIVCEAGFSENWDKLMEDARLWLLCTGGETKIVFVLSFTEQNSTSDLAADSNLESNTTGESEPEPANDATRESEPANDTARYSAGSCLSSSGFFYVAKWPLITLVQYI